MTQSLVAALRDLLAKGLTIEQALAAAEVIANHELSELEARRANDRARKARQRKKKSRDVTGGHVTSRMSQASRDSKSKQRVAKDVTGRHVTELPFAPSPPKELSTPPSTPLPDGNAGARTTLGSRLSDDWTPSEALCAFADGLGIAEHSLGEAVAEFRDYWRGVPGQRGRKLDWDATFRNRLREGVSRKKGSSGNGKRSIVDAADKVIRDLDERFAYLDDVRSTGGEQNGPPAVRLLPGVGRQRP